MLITNIDLIEREVVKKLLHHKSDFLKDIQKNPEIRDKMIVIALDTLGKFDFSEFQESLIHFFDETVINYLDNENPNVREAAVKTCCTINILSNQKIDLGILVVNMLKKMIKKFLVVATTDPELRIRVTMLKHMNR